MILRDAGYTAEEISQDIHRVADNDINRIRRNFHNFGNDLLCNIDVRLRKIQSGLSFFSGNTGCQNHNFRTGGIGIAARVDFNGRAKTEALANIERFAQAFFLIHIDHHDFCCNAVYRQRICDCGTNVAGADYSHFVAHSYSPFIISLSVLYFRLP